MLLFKRIDIIVQLLLAVALLLSILLGSDVFPIVYFTGIAWHLMSLILHRYYYRHFASSARRKKYTRFITTITPIGLVLLFLTGMMHEAAFLFFFFCMLISFSSFFIACWYLAICVKETNEALQSL